MHKLRRATSASTLAVALLAPVGCASDYDSHYMADDQPSHEPNYRLNSFGKGIVGAGLIVAYLAFWAWANSLNECGCNR